MNRKKLEIELVHLKFRHYTENIRIEIADIVRKFRCDDVSDIVMNELWTACRDDIKSILEDDELGDFHFNKITADLMSGEMKNKVRNYIDQALSYEAEVGDLDNDAFEKQYRATFAPLVQEERNYRAQRAQRNDRWAFFNLPDADADYSRWNKRLLTPAQAVALSFAKDPDQVNPTSLGNLRQIGRSPFREAFNDRLKLIEAAVDAEQLSVPMSISEFELWAVGRGIVLPPDLVGKFASEIKDDAAFWKNKFEIAQAELEKLRHDLKPLGSEKRRSLYRLVLGMAISRYEHRTDQRSAATSNIMKDLEEVGLALGDDTIRNHLSEAANDLDFAWTTPKRWHGGR